MSRSPSEAEISPWTVRSGLASTTRQNQGGRIKCAEFWGRCGTDSGLDADGLRVVRSGESSTLASVAETIERSESVTVAEITNPEVT